MVKTVADSFESEEAYDNRKYRQSPISESLAYVQPVVMNYPRMVY